MEDNLAANGAKANPPSRFSIVICRQIVYWDAIWLLKYLDNSVEECLECGVGCWVVKSESIILCYTNATRELNRNDCPELVLGIPSAYSDAAALKAYPKSEIVPCEQFEAAFKAVELWLVDKAVLPIKNSVGGSIHRNYDLLLRHRLHIVGEAVELWLVNKSVLPIENSVGGSIHRNYDLLLRHRLHIVGEALVQCEMMLSKLGIIRVSAELLMILLVLLRWLLLAAKEILEQLQVLELLKYMGLTFLRRRSRFKDGSFHHLLLCPAMTFLVTKKILISSGRYFDYLFYIDFEASMADPRSQFALGHLQEFSGFLCVLGCYPMDTDLGSRLCGLRFVNKWECCCAPVVLAQAHRAITPVEDEKPITPSHL
ncbi:hypothetical protein Q3G72_026396 [Acer saccharum]|nr:hypothetical protein Q3G72_026396 [Acer saccharum]